MYATNSGHQWSMENGTWSICNAQFTSDDKLDIFVSIWTVILYWILHDPSVVPYVREQGQFF